MKKNPAKKKNRGLLVATISVVTIIAVAATLFSVVQYKESSQSQPFRDTVTYTHDNGTETYIIDRTDENLYHIEFQESSIGRKDYNGQARLNAATGHWELDGNGTLVNEDGTWFMGRFANDKIFDGTYNYPDKTRYVGTFRNGNYYDGTYYNENNEEVGRFVEGEWNGKK